MLAQTAQPEKQPLPGENVILLCRQGNLERLQEWLPGARAVEQVKALDWKPQLVVIADTPEVFSPALREAVLEERARLVYLLGTDGQLPAESGGFPVYFSLTEPLYAQVLQSVVQAARENLCLRAANRELSGSLERAQAEINELNSIGIALSAERDVQNLLDLILRTSRQITSSDAGSLYLVEENENTGEKMLRFTLTQNDSVAVPFKESTVPIDSSRICSYVALTGESLALTDAYHLPPGVPFGFSRDFDGKIGYRSMSMLAVPMKTPKGEVVGVLQLINCKKDRSARVTPENAAEVVIPYPPRVQQLLESLASQAAVALENARLFESIQKLF